MYRLRHSAVALLLVVLVAGCDSDFSDLEQYMAEVHARPKGRIEPVPAYPPHESFIYQAMALRGPFTPPAPVVPAAVAAAQSNVKPDLNRAREFLESYNTDALSMVGTMDQRGVRWALIDDGSGGVHRVTIGNYLGRNHGRVVAVEPDQIQLIEIVANGSGGWLERPRTLAMK